MMNGESKLLVCYIPGLDKRRVSMDATPTIAKLLQQHAAVEIRTLPDTELVPTLLSGVYPHQNRIWQVSIDGRKDVTTTQRAIDWLPDIVTTTAQCIRQKFDPDFDLAAIPPRRRREFTQHRFKYTRRIANPEIMQEFNGYRTLFGVLGAASRYHFTHDFEALESLAAKVLASPLKFEFVEMYALDLFQHWHLDDDAAMADALARTDSFVARLHEGCAANGHTLILLSDHGQEAVTGTLPLVRLLPEWGTPRDEYSYFCELACARFWFHTDQARQAIVRQLEKLPNCSLFHFSDMNQFDVSFEDSRFGEYYLMADAGQIFFPHDFYQPLANLYLGLFGHGQRTRITDPVHKGNHGYLPHYPSEKGFLLVADETMKPDRPEMSLVDFAPTMLSLLGEPVPRHMTGRSLL